MPGVLLDSNHVQDYFRKTPAIVSRVNALGENAVIFGCTISLGEIAAGHNMTTPKDAVGQAIRNEYVTWLNEKFAPNAIEVDITVGTAYADLIGRIWGKHPPANAKRSSGTERHLFRQGDVKATLAYMVQQGVDINDVWCVAVAMSYGLTFVTTDEMKWIREAAGNDVKWDCWIPKITTSSPTASPPPS